MPTRDPRVDAYIAKAAPFAKPILKHIRAVVHEACPETEETLKWSAPAFMYKGILCVSAAFKEHATLGFWKGSLILDKNGRKAEDAWGNFGKITSVADLPPRRELMGYIRKAMELNERGVTVKRVVKPKPPLRVPADLTAALKKSRKAVAAFAAFPPSHRREYVEWITEAKTDATRERRIATAVEWITEGKARNWKYEKC
jgi:uncharacterized protein YdeI (YjbR/CyaY-like superfamily)